MHELNDKRVQEIVHEKTILFLRNEVDSRYQLEYLQQIPTLTDADMLEGITQDMVDRVKDFFRDVLYPVGKDRVKRDESVDTVMAILNNPGRMLELLPVMPGFIVRYGGSLLTAARAGLQVISTHRLSVEIEREVASNLQELCEEEKIEIDEKTEIPVETFRRALARVPWEQSEAMITHLKKITRLGMQTKIIHAANELFHEIRKSLHTEDEREAVDYALWVLEQLEMQVKDHSTELMDRLITIAELTERHYLEELYST